MKWPGNTLECMLGCARATTHIIDKHAAHHAKGNRDCAVFVAAIVELQVEYRQHAIAARTIHIDSEAVS